MTETELTPARQKSMESMIAGMYEQQQVSEERASRIATLEKENKLLELERDKLGFDLNDSRVEMARLRTERDQAVAERVAYETLTASVVTMLRDFVPPAEPVRTKPSAREVGAASIRDMITDQNRRVAPAIGVQGGPDNG